MIMLGVAIIAYLILRGLFKSWNDKINKMK